jgi:biopolymer transport protein ExbD
MQLERRRRARHGIALTSLVDVVFILLFFFMLAARAQTPAQLELQLTAPAAAASAAIPVVEVLGGGRLQYGQQVFAADALTTQLAGVSALRLRAQPGSRLQDLVDALDVARRAGIKADWSR